MTDRPDDAEGAGPAGPEGPATGGAGRRHVARRDRARATPPPDRGRTRDRDRGGRGPAGRPATRRPPQVDPARQVALDVLAAVRGRGAYANLTLPGLLTQRGITGRDAALATELTYGTCRALGQLDAVHGSCGDRELARLDGEVVDALRLGTYQLLHTRIPPHAAVSATVELVRAGERPGAAGYVNAVLRRVSEADLATWVERLAPDERTDPFAHLAMAYAHPRWIVEAFDEALGGGRPHPELAAALSADDDPAAVHLVARPGLIDRAELVEETGGTPARFSPYGVYLSGGDPGRIAAVGAGRAAVQDEGSQLVALAVATAPIDGPDARWLDLAAGPGGKTGLLGALAVQRGAAVDAVEPAKHRAELVRRTTAGLPVTVHLVDGRRPGLPSAGFDRVLLDAPCTGLGALRRRPEARWRRQESDVETLTRLQRELLRSAADLVRPGGILGYVTCSPHLAETARIVGGRPQGLQLLDAREALPAGMPELGPGPTVQLWPHRQGTDGMFLALMRRRP